MNYIALFRATLPETALETAALLVLLINLGLLERLKAANGIGIFADLLSVP